MVIDLCMSADKNYLMIKEWLTCQLLLVIILIPYCMWRHTIKYPIAVYVINNYLKKDFS